MSDFFRRKISALYNLLDLDELVCIADVGANPMRHEAPYRDLLTSEACNVVGFEPQEDTMEELVKGKGKNEDYYFAALGDGSSGVLNIHKGSGLTSLLTIRKATLTYLRGLRRAARLVGKSKISTKRMDDIKGLGRIDFLKIDIQGAELPVFSSAQRTLQDVAAIQTEVSFFPLYEEQPTFGEIDCFLRNSGFVPHSFAHIEKRLVVSKWSREMNDFVPAQMLDGDIVYLRDFSSPENISSLMLKRSVVLVEGVFGFSDVTFRILEILLERNEVTESDVLDYIRNFYTSQNET